MVDEFMVVRVDTIIGSAACLQEPSSSSSPPLPPLPNNSETAGEKVGSGAVSVGGENENENDSKSVDGTITKDGILNGGICFSSTKSKVSMSECRICQEEDDDKHLESPCSCRGTLKFAHRKCVQRWCNKKGDITCEICNQTFSPNYTCPPPRGNADVITIDIRQAWQAHIDLHHTRLLAFTEADGRRLQSQCNDYGLENRVTLTCFRSAVVILMLLLLIHQTFMAKLDFGMPQESSVFFHVAGLLLPCYVMAHSWYIVRCQRRMQG